MLLTFPTIVTRWSRSTSNSYALIGQNLTGEFMRKIYAASGKLFTDSWSWQSFLLPCDVFNCLFLLDVRNEIQLLSRFFCNSWLAIIEKLKHRVVHFTQNPRRHVNHRCYIPDSWKGQRIDYKGLPTKRQRSLTPRRQHFLNSSYTWAPIILLRSKRVQKNTKNFNLNWTPLNSQRYIFPTVPRAEL